MLNMQQKITNNQHIKHLSEKIILFFKPFPKKNLLNNNPSAEGLRGESLGIDIVANLKMVGKLAVNKPIGGG